MNKNYFSIFFFLISVVTLSACEAIATEIPDTTSTPPIATATPINLELISPESFPSYNFGYGVYRATAVPTFDAKERFKKTIIDYNYHPPKTSSSELMLYPMMTTTGKSFVYDATAWWQEVAATAAYKPWGDGYKKYATMVYNGLIERPFEVQMNDHDYSGIAPDIENEHGYFYVSDNELFSMRIGRREAEKEKELSFTPLNIYFEETVWRGGVVFINKNASSAFLAYTPGKHGISMYYQNPENRAEWLKENVDCGISGNVISAKMYSNVTYNAFAVLSTDNTLTVCKSDGDVKNFERIMRVQSSENTFGIDVNGDMIAVSFTPTKNALALGVYNGQEKHTEIFTLMSVGDDDGKIGESEVLLSYDNKYALVIFVFTRAFEKNIGGKTNAIGYLTYSVANLDERLVFPDSHKNTISFFTGANFKPVTGLFLAKNLLSSPDVMYIDALYAHDAPFGTTYISLIGVDGYVANVLSMAIERDNFSTIPNVGNLMLGPWRK